uniref:Uncharacterized protein n=1 Tax=Arundo donax TaxID=35708 RepID=A0A0A9FV90_ARUDO
MGASAVGNHRLGEAEPDLGIFGEPRCHRAAREHHRGHRPAAIARHLNTTAVIALKVEQVCPIASLMRVMLSGEISATWVTKLNAVNDSGSPRDSLGGSRITSRSYIGATDGAGSPPCQLARRLQELRRALAVEHQVAEADQSSNFLHIEISPRIQRSSIRMVFLVLGSDKGIERRLNLGHEDEILGLLRVWRSPRQHGDLIKGARRETDPPPDVGRGAAAWRVGERAAMAIPWSGWGEGEEGPSWWHGATG